MKEAVPKRADKHAKLDWSGRKEIFGSCLEITEFF